MTPIPMISTPFFAGPAAQAAYLDWLDDPERERAARTIETLEAIKAESGHAWAMFASALVEIGPKNRPLAAVRRWRQELAAEIESAMEAS